MNKAEKKVIALTAVHLVLFTGPLFPAAAVAMAFPIAMMMASSAVKRKDVRDE